MRVGPPTAPVAAPASRRPVAVIPKPIDVFQKSGRVAFAYGDAAASDAVNPDNTLGDAADYTAARDQPGDDDISFFLLAQPILDLVESTDVVKATRTGRRRSRTSSR